jgi:hypothetical protein
MILLLSSLASGDEGAALYADRTGWAALRSGEVAAVPQSAYRAALQGEIRTGLDTGAEGGGVAWGVGVLSAPVEAIWRGLTDMTGYAEWMPVDVAVALAEAGRSGAVIFQYLDLPLISDRWWCVQQRHNAALYTHSGGRAWELTWSDQHGTAACATLPPVHDGGIPVGWSRGSWLLIDRGDGTTLAEYAISSHPGGSLSPDLVSRFAASSVPATITGAEALARWRQSQPPNSAWRPDGTPLR